MPFCPKTLSADCQFGVRSRQLRCGVSHAALALSLAIAALPLASPEAQAQNVIYVDGEVRTTGVTAPSTLTVGAGASATQSGAITGAGTVTKAGDGTLILTGVNSFAKATISEGALQIRNGGSVTTSGNLSLTGANASLTISGTGSSLRTSANGGLIGSAAGVTMTLEDRGTFRETSGGMGIAQAAGTKATLNVIGAGSQFDGGSAINSQHGDATYNVLAGGVITHAGQLAMGAAISGSGSGRATILISGTGSRWQSSHGYFGNVSLTILDGGVMQNGNMSIGHLTGKTANILISGAGSLHRVNSLTFGTNGTGIITVADGGTFSFATVAPSRVLTINKGGTINIGGAVGEAATGAGYLDVASITLAGGTGTLNFNHTDSNYVFDRPLSGNGTINQLAGTTILTGASSHTGATNVIGGKLVVHGSLDRTSVSVGNGATLGGSGRIAGDVAVAAGGTLAPGASPGTLTVGSLTLNSGSTLAYELGQAGVVGGGINDLIEVTGDLVLDGKLDITDIGGFGPGIYRLMNYAGTLTDNGLDLGKLPSGIHAGDLLVQTAIAKQVNLVSSAGVVLNFWDGAKIAAHDDGAIAGGDGVWNRANRNWTGSNGASNGRWDESFAVFGGAAGTVTVDDVAGAVGATGMHFAVGGYRVEGDALALTAPETIIRVGDGTMAGAGYVATIASQLSGPGNLIKTDLGTLVLTGANSYRGGTTVTGGTVSVSADANLGATAGGLTLDNGTLQNTAAFATARNITLKAGGGTFRTDADLAATGNVSGDGRLIKAGMGTLTLSGANSYMGGTAVSAGTLVGDAASIRGDIGNGAKAVFDQASDASFAGKIVGLNGTGGHMVKRGSGTLTLAGVSSLGWSVEAGKLVSATNRFTGDLAIGAGGAFTFDQNTAGTYAGTLSGAGGFTVTGKGAVRLTAHSSAFAGHTAIRDAALFVDGTLGGIVSVEAGGRLGGTGTVGSTTLAQGATIAPGNSIGTLTVAGNHHGSGGTLEIEAKLDGDASPSDLLAITGNTSGTTSVKVINFGGPGALTNEGIRIVDVGGTSGGAFNLANGDYVFEGRQAMVAGAYAYTLQKNGLADPADGNWYLRSSYQAPAGSPSTPPEPGLPAPAPVVTAPLYQAGAPLYENYANVLQGFNALGTLQQRVGNRSWTGGAAAAADAPATETIEGVGAWARIEAAHGSFEPKTSTTGASYDTATWKFQAGMDGALHESAAGTLIGGLFVDYGTQSSDIASVYGKGKIASTGYGMGGTLTWYGTDGLYVDGQAKVDWYDSDLTSRTASRGLADGNDGIGYAASIETGQRIVLGGDWSLTPQAQLAYSSVDFDDFTDAFGARVVLDRGDSLKGRLGISADRNSAWKDDAGRTARSSLYAIANLHYDFLDGARTDVSGTKFVSENEPMWGGVGLGGSYNWADDRYSLYGEASLNTGLAHFGDSRSINGTAGFRVKF